MTAPRPVWLNILRGCFKAAASRRAGALSREEGHGAVDQEIVSPYLGGLGEWRRFGFGELDA